MVPDTLFYVVKRNPISILADGINKIETLIKNKNNEISLLPIWIRGKLYPNDTLTQSVLEENGYTLKSIPPKGEWIPLRYIESTEDGVRNEYLTNKIHPDNISIALRATQLLNLQVAGIDIISVDISKPWYSNGAVINEINNTPYLSDDEDIKRNTIIPSYLKNIIYKDGRIKITVFIGQEKALEKAKTFHKNKLKDKINCFLTNSISTISSNNEIVHFQYDKLNDRVSTLLFQPDVEELIIVVDNNDILTSGISIDQITKLIIVEEEKSLISEKIISLFSKIEQK